MARDTFKRRAISLKTPRFPLRYERLVKLTIDTARKLAGSCRNVNLKRLGYDVRMATLSQQQVYAAARGAGFPPETARKMVAIAKRESSFNPQVVGTINKAKETSYGLWQINWKDAGIKALLQRNGITEPEQLFDPATNARAAFLLWGGNDANLNVAWYTERVGLQYQQGEKYREFLAALPPVDSFESVYTPGGVIYAGGGGAAEPAGESGSGFDELMNELVTGDGNGKQLLLLAAAGLALSAAVVS